MSYTTSKNVETKQTTMAKKAIAEPTTSAATAELFKAPLVEKNSERAQYSEHSTSGSSSCQVSQIIITFLCFAMLHKILSNAHTK